MSESLRTLFSKASQLDQADRAALAGLLIDSLDPVSDASVDAAWAAEIEQRACEVEQGLVRTVPWEALRDQLAARGQARDRS